MSDYQMHEGFRHVTLKHSYLPPVYVHQNIFSVDPSIIAYEYLSEAENMLKKTN